MERMEFKFDAKAREAGCCVVSGAGFDSVPADVGCLWTQRKFAPAGLPASVESYVTMHCQRRLQGSFTGFTQVQAEPPLGSRVATSLLPYATRATQGSVLLLP